MANAVFAVAHVPAMHWLSEDSARKFHAHKLAADAEARAKAEAEGTLPDIRPPPCPVCRTPIMNMREAKLMCRPR